MSSDSEIYIKTIKTDSELGGFTVTGSGATSLITPNTTKAGYDVSQTSFVVGSTSLDDNGSINTEKRMLYDKATGAFRAGRAESTQWDSANRGTNSTALGLNNIASGINSFAAGSGNTTSGVNSTALGNANIVGRGITSDSTPGSASFAVGDTNIVSGDNSVAIGYSNQIGDGVALDQTFRYTDNSIIIGSNNAILGILNARSEKSMILGSNCSVEYSSYSTAIGQHCTASGTTGTGITNATAIGQYSNASGNNSVAIGYGTNTTTNSNKASGVGSIAIGFKNVSSGSNSVAIGNYCTASYENSFAIGYGDVSGIRNTASAGGSFAIGFGCTASTTNSICMGYRASVDTTLSGWTSESAVERTFFWNGDSAAGSYAYNNGSACFRIGSSGEFRIQNNADAGAHIGSNSSYVWTTNSDVNLKENLVEHNYLDTLERIMEMPIYTYNFKILDPKITNIGPIAQDFNRLFPSGKSALHISDNDKCGVALAGVKGVKLELDSLSTSVDSCFASNSETTSALQSRITVLESSLTSALAQIAALESRLAALETP